MIPKKSASEFIHYFIGYIAGALFWVMIQHQCAWYIMLLVAMPLGIILGIVSEISDKTQK